MLSYQGPLAESVKPGLFPCCSLSSMPIQYYPTHTMDLIPVFNETLRSHNADPVEPYIFRVQDLEEFLKEAYRIVGHVVYSTTSHSKLTKQPACAYYRAQYLPPFNTTVLPFSCPSTAAETACANRLFQLTTGPRQRQEVLDGCPAGGN